jgi:hypothetical protein
MQTDRLGSLGRLLGLSRALVAQSVSLLAGAEKGKQQKSG